VSGCAIAPQLHSTSPIRSDQSSDSRQPDSAPTNGVETQHYTDLSSSIACSKSTDCMNGLLTAAGLSNEITSLSPVLVANEDPHSSSSNSQDSSSSASIGSNQLDNLSASGESSQTELTTPEDNFGEIIKSTIVESVTA
jgi:hypothetical protein